MSYIAIGTLILATLMQSVKGDGVCGTTPNCGPGYTCYGGQYCCYTANSPCACPHANGDGNYDCYNPNNAPSYYKCSTTTTVAAGFYDTTKPQYAAANNARGIGAGGVGTCAANYPASTSGDPLILGFDGCTWYLNGQVGSVVNLLTEKSHVVNSLLVAANLTDEHHSNDGTFHGTILIRYQDAILTSTVDAQGNLTVVLDNKPVPFDTTRELQGLTVRTSQHYPYFGQVAQIVTPEFRFFIHAVQPYDSPAGWSRGHLDFTATALVESLPMHGLLGQGRGKATQLCSEDFAFHGDGAEQDYVLSHLEETDYAHSLFGIEQATIARRLQAMKATVYRATSMRMTAGSAGLASMHPDEFAAVM